jgi:hypothetical protein
LEILFRFEEKQSKYFPMEGFTLKGGTNVLTITFDEVYGFPDIISPWGGYDVRALIEIKSGNFAVKATFWTSTGELFEFFQRLKEHNLKLSKGTLFFNSCEGHLKFETDYDDLGHVMVEGSFSAQNEFANKLKFQFFTDQAYIHDTLQELQAIADKYGDMLGVKNIPTSKI